MITPSQLSQDGVVAVIRHADAKNIKSVAQALLEGGIHALEITVENKGGYEAIEELRNMNDILLGAGTVLTLEQAKASIQAGARFIVSPIFNPEVLEYCTSQDILMIPGVFTPTEIINAITHGASMVKLFPASQLGVGYLKNIKAPIPPVSIMVTGGIDVSNMQSYLEAGAVCVGLGSGLVDLKKSDDPDFLEEVTRKARQAIRIGKR